MAIWYNANDNTRWRFLESNRTYKYPGNTACFTRNAGLNLDPIKSYTFTGMLLKDTQTSNATVPSGNLIATAYRF